MPTRHTKIVATLGPATSHEGAVAELIAAGVDVFRLNFSHGSKAQHRETFARIRAAAARAGRHVAILQDLSGPKIRTGLLEGGRALELVEGGHLTIATGDLTGAGSRVSTTYDELARAVKPGDPLLLDDGRLELRVESTDGTTIETTVVNGGPLGEHKGINAPGVRLPASSLTSKDEDDLAFGLALGVDLVAMSFVQTVDDLRAARGLAARLGHPDVVLVPKIERPEALQEIGAILDAADGVMVARGDLGLELPLEQVPRAQKTITSEARLRGIPVIVATQVLESMRFEPRPTRAEVSDAANAVHDSVDAIMLSGETAIGKFPVRAVTTLDAIIRDAETTPADASAHELRSSLLRDVEKSLALCQAAVTLATNGHAAALVAVTREGNTARVLSALRPPVPIYAVTSSAVVARRLALYRGVVPIVSELGPDMDAAGMLAEFHLVSRGVVRAGELAVFINVSPDLTRTDANFLSIRTVSAR